MMAATRYDDSAAHEAWIRSLDAREPLPPGMDARMRRALRQAAPRTTRPVSFGEGERAGSTKLATSGHPVPLVASSSAGPVPLHGARPADSTPARAEAVPPRPASEPWYCVDCDDVHDGPCPVPPPSRRGGVASAVRLVMAVFALWAVIVLLVAIARPV